MNVRKREILEHEPGVGRLTHQLLNLRPRPLAVRTLKIAELDDLNRGIRSALHRALSFFCQFATSRPEGVSAKGNNLAYESMLQITGYIKWCSLLYGIAERYDDFGHTRNLRWFHTFDLPLDCRIVAKHVMHEAAELFRARLSFARGRRRLWLSWSGGFLRGSGRCVGKRKGYGKNRENAGETLIQSVFSVYR